MTGWGFLSTAIVFWGAWGFLSKLTVRTGLPSAASMTLLGIGYMLVVAVACLPGLEWRSVAPQKMGLTVGLLAGCASAVANIAFYKALGSLDASVAVPVSGLYVAIVVVLAVLFLGEQITATKVLGLVLAFVAAALLAK